MSAARAAGGCLAVVLTLWCGTAGAQPDAAEALFREGRQAMQRGDQETACAKFRESLARYESVGAMLNYAECEAKHGHVVSAHDLWRRSLERLPANDERRAFAEQRMREVAAREGRLRLRLAPGAPAETSMKVDGRDASQGVVELDPGEHRIEAAAPGCSPMRSSAVLREGEERELAVAPGDCSAAATSTPEPPDAHHGSSGLRAAGWISGAVGVAALGVAAVTGVMALQRQSTVNAECNDRQCTPAGLEAGRQGATLVAVNTVAFVVAGVGLATGGILLWASRDRGRTSVGAQPAVGGATVVLRGHL